MQKSFINSLLIFAIAAVEPNPPNWDANKVFVIEPGDSSAQTIINDCLAENGGHQPPDNG